MSDRLHWEKLSDKHQCPTCKNAAVNASRPLGSREDAWRYKVKCNCTSPGHLYFTSHGKMIKAWGDRVRVMKRSIEEQRKTEKEHAGRRKVITKLQLGRKKGQGQAWRAPRFDRRKRKAPSIVKLTEGSGLLYGKRKLAKRLPGIGTVFFSKDSYKIDLETTIPMSKRLS